MTSNGVCLIYELLHNAGFVSFPITDEAREKVDALVANINGTYFGTNVYPDPKHRALAYLYFIIKDHPFTDGNKRTATLTFETVCEINGLNPDYRTYSLDEIAVYVEKTAEEDHHKIIRALAEEVVFPA